MLYARVKEMWGIHAPRGAQVGKWYAVKEGTCWFGSGLKEGYRFIDFGGSFVKAEYVDVCIVAE